MATANLQRASVKPLRFPTVMVTPEIEDEARELYEDVQYEYAQLKIDEDHLSSDLMTLDSMMSDKRLNSPDPANYRPNKHDVDTHRDLYERYRENIRRQETLILLSDALNVVTILPKIISPCDFADLSPEWINAILHTFDGGFVNFPRAKITTRDTRLLIGLARSHLFNEVPHIIDYGR